jgi:hypothetical protein
MLPQKSRVKPRNCETHDSIPPPEIKRLSLSPWLPHYMSLLLLFLAFHIPGFLTVYRVMSDCACPQDRMLHWTKICEVTGEEEPMSRSKTFSGRDDDNLCRYWPAAFSSQARKTGTSAATGSDGSLTWNTQRSDRCSEATRSTTGVTWQFRLSQLNYITYLKSWRRLHRG